MLIEWAYSSEMSLCLAYAQKPKIAKFIHRGFIRLVLSSAFGWWLLLMLLMFFLVALLCSAVHWKWKSFACNDNNFACSRECKSNGWWRQSRFYLLTIRLFVTPETNRYACHPVHCNAIASRMNFVFPALNPYGYSLFIANEIYNCSFNVLTTWNKSSLLYRYLPRSKSHLWAHAVRIAYLL